MDQEMLEYFGEPISVYTQEQALEDGVLMKNPSESFDECSILTTNLGHYIEKNTREHRRRQLNNKFPGLGKGRCHRRL